MSSASQRSRSTPSSTSSWGRPAGGTAVDLLGDDDGAGAHRAPVAHGHAHVVQHCGDLPLERSRRRRRRSRAPSRSTSTTRRSCPAGRSSSTSMSRISTSRPDSSRRTTSWGWTTRWMPRPAAARALVTESTRKGMSSVTICRTQSVAGAWSRSATRTSAVPTGAHPGEVGQFGRVPCQELDRPVGEVLVGEVAGEPRRQEPDLRVRDGRQRLAGGRAGGTGHVIASSHDGRHGTAEPGSHAVVRLARNVSPPHRPCGSTSGLHTGDRLAEGVSGVDEHVGHDDRYAPDRRGAPREWTTRGDEADLRAGVPRRPRHGHGDAPRSGLRPGEGRAHRLARHHGRRGRRGRRRRRDHVHPLHAGQGAVLRRAVRRRHHHHHRDAGVDRAGSRRLRHRRGHRRRSTRPSPTRAPSRCRPAARGPSRSTRAPSRPASPSSAARSSGSRPT